MNHVEQQPDLRRASPSEIAIRELPRADLVTSVIQHEVKPGAEAEYEAWLTRITPIAERFPGHRGIHFIRPVEGSSTYTVLLRFDTLEHAQDWLKSAARQALVSEVAHYLKSNESIEIKTGLEFWFKPPSGRKQPSPLKQSLVTLAVLYPLTLIVPALVSQASMVVTALSNRFVASLVIDAIIVALLTYVFMPRITRLLSKWLFS
jgi:antibiotic biosynthesis monooxygenase (ABM) superfamily enzyme